MHGLEIGGTFNSGGSIFLSVGTRKSKLQHPTSLILLARPRYSISPLSSSKLGGGAASVAAGTMARIVNLHSTFVNREIKAILDQMPTKSYTCATFSRGIIGGKKRILGRNIER